MTAGVDKNQSATWSKQAFEGLVRDALSPTPHNYAVYYHVAAGDIPALLGPYNNAVAAASGRLTQRQCTELYDRYVTTNREGDFLKNASNVIDAELKKMMDLIGTTIKDNAQFGENLDDFSGKLNAAPSIEMLRDAVGKIADETRQIAAQNTQLQGDLAAATHQLTEIREDFDRVHKEAHIDALTEIGNRKYFDREILAKMQEAQAEGITLSLLMIDIDYFKNFNDTHGHLLGDQVLRLVAKTLVENLKGRDVIARYGGEEFVILLPQTKLQDAERVANQLRASLATKHIKRRGSHEILGTVTISLGAAEYNPGEDGDTLIARADAGLYKAKEGGRNRVVCLAVDRG